MSRSFDEGHARVHVFSRWETSPLGEPLTFADALEAKSLLRTLSRTPQGTAGLLRLVAEAQPSRAPLADLGEVIEELSHRLARGVLRVTREPHARLFIDREHEEEEAAAAPAIANVREADEPAPVEPSTFDDVAAAEQAAVLRDAAVLGVAFCEECAKVEPQDDEVDVDAEAQAETLRAASKSGVPFCEECEKKRAAAEKRAA